MNKIILFIRILNCRNVVSHCNLFGRNTTVHVNQLRFMSIGSTPKLPQEKPRRSVSIDEFRNFMAVFPELVKDLTESGHYSDTPDVNKWIEKLLQYNVPNGKKNRGLALVHSYKMLCSESELTDENIKLSYVLGWCVEIFQSFALVSDDIMDNAITRRGRLCWHRLDNVGLTAINDAIILEGTVYQLIEKYFKDKTYYTQILEMFHEITMKSTMGQCLDMLTAESFKLNKLDKFTMDNYSTIVKYKSSYYSLFFPVYLAMQMANIKDPELFRQAKTILLEIGHILQVQDDYLSCYGNPNVIGKIGPDIESGKCTWLAVVALQKSNPQQRKIMEENYGIDDPVKVKIIKDLYDELKIPVEYEHFEKEQYNLICTHIQKLSQGLSKEMFFYLLESYYKKTL